MRVPDVHRPHVFGQGQANDPLDQVIHEAERAGLLAVAMDRDRLTPERLLDERRTRPSRARILGPYVLNIRTIRTGTP